MSKECPANTVGEVINRLRQLVELPIRAERPTFAEPRLIPPPRSAERVARRSEAQASRVGAFSSRRERVLRQDPHPGLRPTLPALRGGGIRRSMTFSHHSHRQS